MTDIATLTPAELEARIAELERRLGVEPAALVPPLTIGELTDVPAPGSQLAAAWAQEISSRIVQRFPTAAALQAWAAPPGAFAVQTDTGVLWRRIAAGWSQQTPWQARIGGTPQQPPTTAPVTVASIVIPADAGARIVTATGFVRILVGGACIGFVDLVIDGQLVAQGWADNRAFPQNPIEYTLCVASTGDLPAGRPVTVATQVASSAPSGVQSFAEFYRNRLDVTVMAKG